MKLLFDANISRKIVPMIEDLFQGSSHVALLGFSGETRDDVIWETAKANEFTIITADSDFLRLSAQYGPPPKVIRLERMNYSTRTAADLIRRNAIAISEFGASHRGVLLLRRA